MLDLLLFLGEGFGCCLLQFPELGNSRLFLQLQFEQPALYLFQLPIPREAFEPALFGTNLVVGSTVRVVIVGMMMAVAQLF